MPSGFPRRLLAGGAVALAGATVIALATSHARRRRGRDGRGALPARRRRVRGTVVAQKPLLARVSALSVTWPACTIGAAACLPFAPGLAGVVLARRRPPP